MKLEELLNSGGELMGFGFETIKKPYQMNINFFPEFFSYKKKYKFKPNQRLNYLVSDYRSMEHWNPIDNKIFDIDVLENNWEIYQNIKKNSKTYLTNKIEWKEAIPSISLGKTFFLGKIHRSKNENLFLNNFNFYACSLFLIKNNCVYIPFKLKIETNFSNKRKTVQEFYEAVDHPKILDIKVLCANTILTNLPMHDVRSKLIKLI